MPAHKVSISIDREARSITPGAIRCQDLINLAKLGPNEQLLFEVDGDVDIPLSARDVIFVRGGEQFSIGDGQPAVPENPRIRNPLTFVLNDVENQQLRYAKLTGAELKTLAGSNNDVDLWADLDGLADEIIEDDDRIILQKHDRFFTVPREEEDEFYEVIVILDGEDRQYRFSAKITVRDAIRQCLPHSDQPKIDEFDMADGNIGTGALDPNQTLEEVGVRDGHVLSITKKNGGGG